MHLILLKLFVAVTLRGFDDVQREDKCKLTDKHIDKYKKVWKQFDPDGTGYIHLSEAGTLLKNLYAVQFELFPPKSRDLMFDMKLLQHLVEHLDFTLYNGYQCYNFHDILMQLSKMYVTYLSSKPSEL